MAINIPNPYAGPDSKQSVTGMGLHAAPTAKNAVDLGGIGGQLNDAARKYLDELDKTRVLEATNKLKLYGDQLDDDPETGWKSQKGARAFQKVENEDLPRRVMKTYDEKVAELRGELNFRQRGAFDAFVKNDRAIRQVALDRHMVEQARSMKTEQQQISYKIAIDSMGSGDPTKYMEGHTAAMALLQQTANESGSEIYVPDKLSAAHRAGIIRMASTGQVREAKAFFEKFKDELNSDDAWAVNEAFKKIDDAQRVKVAAANTHGKSETQRAFLVELSKRKLSDAEIVAEIRKQWPELIDSEVEKSFKAVKSEMKSSDSLEAITALDGIRKQLGDGMSEVQISKIVQDQLKDRSEAVQAEVIKLAINGRKTRKALEEDRRKAMAETISNADVSDEQLYAQILQDNPDMPQELVRQTAVEVRAIRLKEKAEKAAIREEEVSAAFDTIANGGKMSDIIDATHISDNDRTGLQEYEKRKELKSLVTDNAEYWRLTSEPEYLASKSMADLYAMAWKFTPSDFEHIIALKTGNAGASNYAKIEKLVLNTFDAKGLLTSKKDQATKGMIVRQISHKLKYEYDNFFGGKVPENPAEVNEKVGQILATQYGFLQSDSLFDRFKSLQTRGTSTEFYTVEDIASGEVSIHPDIEKVLEDGVKSTGISSPSDEAFYELLLVMKLNPRRPVPGADAMVSSIRLNHPDYLNSYVKQYTDRYKHTPTNDQIVRAFFDKTLFSMEK